MDTVSIDPKALHSLIGSARAPLIVDVRRAPAFDATPVMIPGALRPEGDLCAYVKPVAAGRPVVAYCVAGHEVSQQAAAALSAAGHDARYLEGGLEAWKAAALPTIRRHPEWRVPGGSRWITRERPKIDRIACPWLIQRFIDPLARFDYVPTKSVLAEAESRGAVPYDIRGGRS